MYKTQDLYELNDNDHCFVIVQCACGKHNLSPNLRPAIYNDDFCKRNGYDFHVKTKSECESIEVVGVWKYEYPPESIKVTK